MQTERKYDMRAEREVSNFLCAYFYPALFPGFQKETSLDMQYAGVDVSSGSFLIDEKCQLERLNRCLIPTQCLELCSINRAGQFSLGWYLDTRKKTTHYLFSWVSNCNVSDKRDLTLQDVHEMKCILVSVAKLKQYFASIGVTDAMLHREMLNMLVHNKADKIMYNKMYKYLNGGTRIVKTLSKKEAPINFVVPREIYEHCCDGKFVVTRNGVVRY